VCHADAIGTVDVERLGLGAGAGTSSRVAEVPDAHRTGQILEARAIAEDFGGHAVALGLVNATSSSASGDTTSILTSVLQEVQSFVEVDGSLAGGVRIVANVAEDHTKDTTHLDGGTRSVAKAELAIVSSDNHR